MADQDEDFTSLPLLERLAHKARQHPFSGLARQSAYDECAKIFRTLDPDADAEYRKYQEYLKKMATDANIVAQEAGVNAILAFVENAPFGAKTRHVLAPIIVEKCLGSTRAGTKAKGIEVLLMYIEVENKSDGVIEDVISGLDHKTPKLVVSCITVLKEALRWLGQAIAPSLAELKPVQIKELNELFESLTPDRPVPERYVRAEQIKRAEAGPLPEDAVESEIVEVEAEPVDQFDISDPVNVLDKMPPKFYDELASTKWKERKEILEALLVLVKVPKLEDGRYGELVNALSKSLEDGDAAVRDAAAECFGTLMKLVTERALASYLEKIDKSKEGKIRESFEKAETKLGGRRITKPEISATASIAPKRPASSSAVGKTGSAAATSKADPVSTKRKVAVEEEPITYRYNDETSSDWMSEHFPDINFTEFGDANWKVRLGALKIMSPSDIEAEAVTRTLLKSPGWKESNFQVVTCMINMFILVSKSQTFKRGSASLLVAGVGDKLGDMKVKKVAAECLTSFAEAVTLQYVLSELYEPLTKAKSPKLLSDSLLWIHQSILEFGIKGIHVKELRPVILHKR
ncbi:Microtubule-associated protein, microtubule dynamics during spindle orientation [Irineochytrium annulatum]|nr:Microtubule-associated protein, microtubule dynamics during spindle orientation [Irineochytrium annulatum]